MTFFKNVKKFVCFGLAVALSAAFFGCSAKKGYNYPESPIYIDTKTPETTEESIAQTENPATPTPELPDFKFTGKAICVVNDDTGEVLFAKNEGDRNLIASVTKYMTALVALDWLDVDDTVTVVKEALGIVATDPEIDRYGFKGGESVTIDDLLALLLIKSYGDAAEILRYFTEIESGRDFFELMNEKAQDLGMTSSHFDNSIGLDIENNCYENYSTAEDTVKLLRAAMKNETIVSKSNGKPYEISNGAVLEYTNAILKNGTGTDTFEAFCGKIGTTNAAQHTLAIAFTNNLTGEKYAVVYLYNPSWTDLNSEILDIVNYFVNGVYEG